jgi:uncharacterized protein YlaI
MSATRLSTKDNKNIICEAIGCLAKATFKIDVKVGQNRAVTLYLCGNCIDKFEDQ